LHDNGRDHGRIERSIVLGDELNGENVQADAPDAPLVRRLRAARPGARRRNHRLAVCRGNVRIEVVVEVDALRWRDRRRQLGVSHVNDDGRFPCGDGRVRHGREDTNARRGCECSGEEEVGGNTKTDHEKDERHAPGADGHSRATMRSDTNRAVASTNGLDAAVAGICPQCVSVYQTPLPSPDPIP